jgi:hypothetical protein
MWIWCDAFDNGSTNDGPDAQTHPLQITVMKMPLPDRKRILTI